MNKPCEYNLPSIVEINNNDCLLFELKQLKKENLSLKKLNKTLKKENTECKEKLNTISAITKDHTYEKSNIFSKIFRKPWE